MSGVTALCCGMDGDYTAQSVARRGELPRNVRDINIHGGSYTISY